MSAERSPRVARRFEWIFGAIGVSLLAWCGLVAVQAAVYQSRESSALDRILIEQEGASASPTRGVVAAVPGAPTPPALPDFPASPASPALLAPPALPAPRVVPKHQLIGRLEIPRVRMSTMVVDGDDEATLRKGAGHLPDTPLPWEFGNSAIAGHRDTFFRALRSVKVNDRVRLTTPHGTFQYVVSKMTIVEPSEISVLATKGQSSLTLVTCYPFSYVGNAPKRFIVQADHVPN